MTLTQMPHKQKSPQVITPVDHLSKLKKADITNCLSANVAPATMNRLELLSKMKPFTIPC